MRNPRKYWKPKPKPRSLFMALIEDAPAVVAGIVLAGVAGVYGFGDSLVASARGCNIKANISINTGERIYHVPGQEYYSQTRISPEHGERWFCTEEEARTAGWRKART